MKKQKSNIKLATMITIIFSMCITGCGLHANEPVIQTNESVEASDKLSEVEKIQDEPIAEEAAVTFEIEADNDARAVYEQFIGISEGQEVVKAIIDEGVSLGYYNEEGYAGNEYTFDELSEEMLHGRNLAGDELVDPVPYYSFLEIDGETLLALKYQGMSIYSANDDSFSVLILKYQNEELHVTYSYSEWARQSTDLLVNGVLFTAGSAGAGENIYDGGFIDANGQYHRVYMNDWVTDMWIMMSGKIDNDLYFETYLDNEDESDNSGNSNLALNVYYFGEVDEEDPDTDMIIVPEAFQNDSLTSLDEQFIEQLKAAGKTIKNQDEILEEIEKQFMSIGGIANYTEADSVSWSIVEK